jgi:regulator of sigma E protease
MQVFNTVAQFLLSLTFLVALHEWGHFIAARLFKIRVDKFYVFFDFLFPLPNVMNFALFKKKIGDTEYGLGWFPLGGYVSIAGMVDETQDASKLAATPEPWEFRSKPAWQRLVVMLGGIIVNIILGILIFSCLTYKFGEPFVSKSEANKYGIVARELARKVGFQNGDKIVKINGQEFEKFDDVLKPSALLGDQTTYTIERNGQTKDIVLPKTFLNDLSSKANKGKFIGLPTKFHVHEVTADSPASKAGLKADDVIVKIDSIQTNYYHEFQEALEARKSKATEITVLRKGQELKLNATVSNEGTLGFKAQFDSFIKSDTTTYSLLGSISRGTERAFEVFFLNIKGFGKIFKGEVEASKALSGPIGMAKNLFGSGVWDWVHFWEVTGLLSMALAFMNLLPIPALDGGHAVTLIWEMITGKPLSVKTQEVLQQIGTFLILALTVYVFYNDIFGNR